MAWRERGVQHPCFGCLKAAEPPAGLGASTHGAQLRGSTGAGGRAAGTEPLSQGNPHPSAAHRPDLLTAQTPNSLIIHPLTATFAGVGGELESRAVPSHERGIVPGRGRALDGDTRPGCPPHDTLPGPGDGVSSWQGAQERPGEEAQPLDQQGALGLSARLQPRLSVLLNPDIKAPAVERSPGLWVPWREGTDRGTSACTGFPFPLRFLPAGRQFLSETIVAMIPAMMQA